MWGLKLLCGLKKSNFFLADDECDIAVNSSNTDQYIVWAIGGVGETAFVHFSRADG